MSAELKVHFPRSEVVLVHSRDTLLSNEPLTDEYKSIAYNLLTQAGVKIMLGQRVVEEREIVGSKEVTLSTGETIQCDKVIYTAQQQGANTGFVASEILDAKGCIQTRET
jgi:NADH dehydrogenase FAD-containing subunit